MTKYMKNSLALFCHAYVGQLFASFLAPNMRGKEFRWNNFPLMANRQCRSQVHISVIFPPNTSKRTMGKYEEFVGTIGEAIALELVRLSEKVKG